MESVVRGNRKYVCVCVKGARCCEGERKQSQADLMEGC